MAGGDRGDRGVRERFPEHKALAQTKTRREG